MPLGVAPPAAKPGIARLFWKTNPLASVPRIESSVPEVPCNGGLPDSRIGCVGSAVAPRAEPFAAVVTVTKPPKSGLGDRLLPVSVACECHSLRGPQQIVFPGPCQRSSCADSRQSRSAARSPSNQSALNTSNVRHDQQRQTERCSLTWAQNRELPLPLELRDCSRVYDVAQSLSEKVARDQAGRLPEDCVSPRAVIAMSNAGPDSASGLAVHASRSEQSADALPAVIVVE